MKDFKLLPNAVIPPLIHIRIRMKFFTFPDITKALSVRKQDKIKQNWWLKRQTIFLNRNLLQTMKLVHYLRCIDACMFLIVVICLVGADEYIRSNLNAYGGH